MINLWIYMFTSKYNGTLNLKWIFWLSTERNKFTSLVVFSFAHILGDQSCSINNAMTNTNFFHVALSYDNIFKLMYVKIITWKNVKLGKHKTISKYILLILNSSHTLTMYLLQIHFSMPRICTTMDSLC